MFQNSIGRARYYLLARSAVESYTNFLFGGWGEGEEMGILIIKSEKY